ESLIRNAALQDIGMMLLVKAHQRFGRDGVGSPLAAAGDGCLEPSLFDPENDLFFSDAECVRKALHGKQITLNLAQAELVSIQHVADRLRGPIDLLRNIFDRSLDEF